MILQYKAMTSLFFCAKNMEVCTRVSLLVDQRKMTNINSIYWYFVSGAGFTAIFWMICYKESHLIPEFQVPFLGNPSSEFIPPNQKTLFFCILSSKRRYLSSSVAYLCQNEIYDWAWAIYTCSHSWTNILFTDSLRHLVEWIKILLIDVRLNFL